MSDTVLMSVTDNVKQLSGFLARRQAKVQAIGLIRQIKATHNLDKTQINVSNSDNYDKIATTILDCLDKNWFGTTGLIDFLDMMELSGRQHVLLFRLPEDKIEMIFGQIEQVFTSRSAPVNFEEFFVVPDNASARKLGFVDDEFVGKLVTPRSYWINTYEIDKPEEKLIRRKLERERSAIIIRYSRKDNILQFRIPPKEQGQSETGKGVYQFLYESLTAAIGREPEWIHDLETFPIQNTFPNIISDSQNFILKHDTPENNTVAHRLTKKGAMHNRDDLRDDPDWHHTTGYARRQIKGSWLNADSSIVFMHLTHDTIIIDRKTSRDLSRLFVPRPCSEGALQDAISRILAHLR